MPEKNQSIAPENFKTLTYPSGLNPNNFYPEAMCFTIRKRIGLSLKEVSDEVNARMIDTEKQITQIDAAVVQHKASIAANMDENEADKVKAAALENIGTNTVEVLGRQLVKSGQNLRRTRDAKIQGSKTGALDIGHIYLNMPQSISNTDSISWNATPLGAIGSMTKSAIEGGGGGSEVAGAAVGNAGNIAGAGLGGMLAGLVKKLKIPGGVGVGMLAGALGGGAVQSGLSATLGMSSNPYEEMMFSGITFRSFSFDFIFRPENSTEIKEVSNIIKMFRKYSRPSFVGGKLGNSTMNYPMEFQIEFLTADSGTDSPSKTGTVYKTNNHLPKIKLCVCEGITTNYTPNSVWAAYKAGAPVAISLSLTFKEKELVMDTDIEDGF